MTKIINEVQLRRIIREEILNEAKTEEELCDAVEELLDEDPEEHPLYDLLIKKYPRLQTLKIMNKRLGDYVNDRPGAYSNYLQIPELKDDEKPNLFKSDKLAQKKAAWERMLSVNGMGDKGSSNL